VTVTDATGVAVTVMSAVAERPSADAVIVVWPPATATTSPLGVTVATFALLLVQEIVRPVSTFPPASRGVAVSWSVCPELRPALVWDNVIDAIGAAAGVTVTCDDPLAVPAVAVTVTGPPADTPVTTPADDTVAIDAFEVVQFVTRVVQLVCVTAAVSVPVVPATMLSVVGVTTTELTEHRAATTSKVNERRPAKGTRLA
jgi:hypothetical protein